MIERECLELGSQVGLDIALITKSVVEHVKNAGPVRCCNALLYEVVSCIV